MGQHSNHINKACSACEYILDIYFQDDITHIWTKLVDGQTNHYRFFYHPLIYVAADTAADQYAGTDNRSLEEIASIVRDHPQVIHATKVQRYLDSAADQPSDVLEISVYSPQWLDEVISDFRGRNLNLYNIDLNIRQQFFLDTQSSPMLPCHLYTREATIELDYQFPSNSVELERVSLHGDPAAIIYPIPKVRMMDIKLDLDQNGTFPGFDDPLQAIKLEMRYFDQQSDPTIEILTGSENQILLDLVQTIKRFDPDFLNIINGDKFVMNYLAHRAEANGITNQFILGRLPIPSYPRKDLNGQTYVSYGQIRRREAVWYLAGRVHIDAENSFFMFESGLAGLIDLSRMAGVPPERTSRSSIGTALTGIEFKVNASTLPPTLVPPNKATGEQFKPAEHLLISDNGGLIYPGLPGVHDRVWAIDFTSLYPMIMGLHNIGNETVLCDHDTCKDGVIVPEVNYHICQQKIGVVPRTMYLVLTKRLKLKQAKRKAKDLSIIDRFKGIDSAMKWILVSCFGYLGFKNARWGSIESHQCVTAYARRYLLQAKQTCEQFGFEVLAGITDSLFVRAKDPRDDTREHVDELVCEVSKNIGIALDIEGRFNWVVFCNIKEYTSVAALNRYYGYFDHDQFKLRGVKHRQRRACKVEMQFQEDILDVLAHAKTVDEFKALIPVANSHLVHWKEKLLNYEVDARDLIIKLKSTRGAQGYRATSTVQALTVKKYREQGREIKPGQNFFYLVRDDSLRTTDRVVIGPNVISTTHYDAQWYANLLERDFQELLEAPQQQLFGDIRYTGNPDGEMTRLDEFFDEEQHLNFPVLDSSPNLDDYF